MRAAGSVRCAPGYTGGSLHGHGDSFLLRCDREQCETVDAKPQDGEWRRKFEFLLLIAGQGIIDYHPAGLLADRDSRSNRIARQQMPKQACAGFLAVCIVREDAVLCVLDCHRMTQWKRANNPHARIAWVEQNATDRLTAGHVDSLGKFQQIRLMGGTFVVPGRGGWGIVDAANRRSLIKISLQLRQARSQLRVVLNAFTSTTPNEQAVTAGRIEKK
jgi:hypothetical protein